MSDSRFLELPAELRNQIYDNVVPSEVTVVVKKIQTTPDFRMWAALPDDDTKSAIRAFVSERERQAIDEQTQTRLNQGVTIIVDTTVQRGLITSNDVRVRDYELPAIFFEHCTTIKIKTPVVFRPAWNAGPMPNNGPSVVGHITTTFRRPVRLTKAGSRALWEFDEDSFSFDSRTPDYLLETPDWDYELPEDRHRWNNVYRSFEEEGVGQLGSYIRAFGKKALRNWDLSSEVLGLLVESIDYSTGPITFTPKNSGKIDDGIDPIWRIEDSFKDAVEMYWTAGRCIEDQEERAAAALARGVDAMDLEDQEERADAELVEDVDAMEL